MTRKPCIYLCLFLIIPIALAALEIHDSPMVTSFRPPPAHLVFILDDSETMAWEIHLENTPQGLFQKENSSELSGFIFDLNLRKNSGSTDTLSDSEKFHWKLRSSSFNTLYYNPSISYHPWPATKKYPSMGKASLLSPKISPTSDKTFALLDPFMELPAKEKEGGTVQDDDFAQFSGSGWIREETADPPAFRGAFHRTASHDAKALFSFELSETGKKEIGISWPAFKKNSPLAKGKASIRVLDHEGKEMTSFSVDQGEDPQRSFSVHIKELNPMGPDLYLEIIPGSYGDESLLLVDKVWVDEPMIIPNAHYFIFDHSDPKQEKRSFMVSFCRHRGSLHRKIHEIDPQSKLEIGLFRGVQPSDLPENLQYFFNPELKSESFLTPEEDLQNFSNWFQYYRNKFLVMQSGLVRLTEDFSHVNPGFLTFSGQYGQAVIPMDSSKEAAKRIFLESLYKVQVDRSFKQSEKNTAKVLETVGKYLATHLVPESFSDFVRSPYYSEEKGGACQQAFAFLLTDGLDGQKSFSKDIVARAREFYERDLAPNLPDLLATSAADPASHQHMVTNALVFGAQDNPGDTSPDSEAIANEDPLFLAASEGRGFFGKENHAAAILSEMQRMHAELEIRAGYGISGQGAPKGVLEGKVFFRTEFDALDWSGDLKAFSLTPYAESTLEDAPLWSAAQELSRINPDTRVVLSAFGTEVFPFRQEYIPNALKKDLLQAAVISPPLGFSDLVNRIRGMKIDGFRQSPNSGEPGARYENRLGDIVNSTPLHHRGILYVGANDGMLHAFSADTGKELFAFIPSFVYPELWQLTRKDYGDNHRYFVDGPISIQTATLEGKTKDLLVGGLGKGGRGYYGMVLQNNARWAKEKSLSESALVSDLDIWEFPPPTKRAMEKDMGYSYSKVALVRSNLSKHPWIAVFGNGYDSPSEKAVLIILDAFTGEEIRRIPTGEERGNGLSSPALVDTDRDGKADWVYAGDLKGNLWKFDISSSNPDDWHVFFQKGSTEKPLFTCEGPGGAPQAITAKPAIARHCSGLGYMVLWGTGQHLGLPDLENFSVQTLYGVWDYGDKTANLGILDRKENSGYLHGLDSGSFGPSLHLVRQTIEAASFSTENALEGEVGDDVLYPVASHTKNPQTYTWEEKGKSLKDGSTVGWFFDFPEKGERMTEDALIHESAVFATSFVPACIASPCTAGGHSWINALDLCSGQRLPRIFFDINMNKTLEGAQMSQENTDPGDALVVSGTSYEVSRLKIPATAFLIGIFSGSGFEYLLMLDLHGERMLPMEINKAADKIFYWRMR